MTILAISYAIYERTNNQHLISHTHVVGVTLYTMASSIPAFIGLYFFARYVDYLTILVALVIISVVAVGFNAIRTWRSFRHSQ